MKRIIIAGTGSGCGKTSVVCGILSALVKRGTSTASFKCGPDYIDPMFHEKVIGTPSYNLDSFFCDDITLCGILNEYGSSAEISVIEGVMGFYDGSADGRGSAYSVSQITDTPAVIVIDCRGMSESLGAVMKGFLTYKENSHIAGFIFNRLPLKLRETAEKLCADLGTEYLGIMPQNSCSFESRHLGLVTADEIKDIKEKTDGLGTLAEENILIDRLLQIAGENISEIRNRMQFNPVTEKSPVIAVARDKAFCFIYNENTDFLKKSGCEIKYFPPLEDSSLPENTSGIILCGGYPELYTKRLWENRSIITSIRKAVKNGMPVIAECGGFMYLHTVMENTDGTAYEMADIIRGKAYKTDKLQRFGYITMTAQCDSLIAEKGEKIKAHEFHYWDSTNCGNGFIAVKSNGKQWECGVVSDTMYCGFPHLYFYGCPEACKRFINKCTEYGERQ